MAARLITAGLGIPLFLGMLYLGGPWWAGLVLLLAVLACWEMGFLLRTVSPVPDTPSRLLLLAGGVLFVVAAYTSDGMPPAAWSPVAVGLTFAAFLREILRPVRAPMHGVGWTLFGAVYPGALFAHLVLLRNLTHGFEWLLLATLATWASDSAAFFVGMTWGQRPLAPALSPKKTWEGAAGGLCGGALTGALFAGFTSGVVDVGFGLAAGLLVSAAGQIGDLAASALKRQAAVKDTGAILPGHGGIIDRFDSLLFAGAVLYYGLLLTGRCPVG